jgi:CheY-like chemotaxis protein
LINELLQHAHAVREPSFLQEGIMERPTSIRILIIDDELTFVAALARVLSKDGFTVGTATHGELALARLQKHRYDVVLCDLRMPELDGPAFFERLRRQHAYLRQGVIFLTGDIFGAESMAVLEQCDQPWLTKPCHADEIRSAIQRMRQAVEGAF